MYTPPILPCLGHATHSSMRASLLLGVFAVGAAKTVNLTLYRITPRNYTGVTNMDTGDAAGDAFFGLYELSFPVLCADPSFRRGTGCHNVPILSIPHFNVYTKNIIEADARFGDYSECNPDAGTGKFGCTHFMRSGCWQKNPRYANDFAGLCDPAQCKCDLIEKRALGWQSLAHRFGPSTNGTLPKTCPAKGTGLSPLDGMVLSGLAFKNESGLTAAECCARCATHDPKHNCSGYTFLPDASGAGTGSCARFGVWVWGAKRAPGAQSAFAMPGGGGTTAFIFHALGKLGKLLGGSWYSTRGEGECTPSGNGSAIGKDCWWRLRSVERRVNSTCVNGRLVDRVLKAGPRCFESCPQPTNRSSACWVRCLFQTITGNASDPAAPPAMAKATLVGAFEGAFAPESGGGCPQVPDCPPPCRPPAVTGAVVERPNSYGWW